MRCLSLWTVLLLAMPAPVVQMSVEPVEASRCHVFIDYNNIWTFEMAQSSSGKRTPIVNIITFDEQESPLRPGQIHVFDAGGREAVVDRFSIDTGIAGEPYVTNYLKVLSSSFIAMDLVGDFEDFPQPSRVVFELGEAAFSLQAVDCMDFDMLAERINRINFDSPNIKEDFSLLKIEHIGSKNPRKTGRR
ncbi:MAG: hypothetical protein ACE5JX_03005 [Acidobacteriota bacterium]